MSQNGKGDTPRKVNRKKWSDNYDRIFRKKEELEPSVVGNLNAWLKKVKEKRSHSS